MKPYLLAPLLCLITPLASAQPANDAAPWLTWQPLEITLPQPNAFDTYLKAFDLKLKIDHQQGLGELPPPQPADAPPDRWHVGPPDLPVPERVALYADVLTLIRQALAQECRVPPPQDPNEAMPYFQDFRTLLRLLAMEAEAKRLENDFAAAAQSALDALRVAQDAKTQRTLLAGMVGIACEAMAFASLDETIPGLSSAEIRAVLAQLFEIEAARVPIEDAFVGEETVSRAQFRRIAIDPDHRVHLEDQLLEHPEFRQDVEKGLALRGIEGWDDIGNTYAAFRQYAALPRSQRPAQPPAAATFLMQIVVPSITRTVFQSDRALNNFRLHQAQLAARAYLLDNQQLPQSLEALVPDYLPAVPADTFGDGPLRSVLAENGLTIHSVGPDGVDNGGKPHEGKFPQENSKGDIIVTISAKQ